MVYSCGLGMAERVQGDEWLSINEIAAELKLARETVRLWLARGDLPAIRAGHSWRVRRSDLERMLTSQGSLPGSNPLTMATDTDWPEGEG